VNQDRDFTFGRIVLDPRKRKNLVSRDLVLVRTPEPLQSVRKPVIINAIGLQMPNRVQRRCGRLDMEAMNLKAGKIVDIYSHFEGEVRMAPRFAIVPYAIARRSAAACYPETNVLIPIRSVAAKSNQPAAKCIRITLTPSDYCESLNFPQAALDHNLGRSVPRVP
jgi:hypothetical protein